MALVENLYIYVIDGSEGFWSNPVDWVDSAFTIGDITVTSVTDMVDKVLKVVGSRHIQNLFIGGHGDSGWQSVGAGSGDDLTGSKSLQVDPKTGLLLGPAETQLRRFRGKFSAKDPVCTLGGCLVAKGTAGSALLKAVSSALGGIPAQGGTSNQRPLVPGLEGDVIRCTPSACHSMGHSWWASPGSWVQ
ncbi:MAG: hypothetical protein U0167_00480 [bacterium]